MPDLIYMNVTAAVKALLRKFFLGYSTDKGFVEFREKPTDDERQQLSTILCKNGYTISDSNSQDSDNSWPLNFASAIRYAIKKQGNQLPEAP